ncbi:MAG: hypothetical protein AAGF26_16985 [Cyanobacteria bacterium P01_G01_bin.49]
MSITVTGKIEKQGFGFGTWALITESGETYELKDLPSSLQQPLSKVQIEGNIREDVMTVAMIGPVLEVSDFEILAD